MLPINIPATDAFRATSLVPLTIIGGFLGSGKTSLINHILNHSTCRRVAVLVNDFGSINIDAKLIVSVQGETVSLANGCLCCTIRHDLLREVINLLERDPLPDHIVIETSGVSRPVAVAETFLSLTAQRLVDMHHMISMLDADLTVDPNAGYGDLAFDQIKTADMVVINKTDTKNAEEIAQVVDYVRANTRAIFGFDPAIYPVSGKLALESKLGASSPREWTRSNFESLEDYIFRVLSEKERVRLKLQAPLDTILSLAKTEISGDGQARAQGGRSEAAAKFPSEPGKEARGSHGGFRRAVTNGHAGIRGGGTRRTRPHRRHRRERRTRTQPRPGHQPRRRR